MPKRFDFSPPVMQSVVGGKSVLDLHGLHIKNAEDAGAFLAGYGFDLTSDADQQKLWYFHRRALVFLEEKLGFGLQEIPEMLRDPKQLGDLRQLLLLASERGSSVQQLQRWACAILRVMHVFVHTENDLFSTFTEEIQKQILGPFQQCIVHEGSSGQSILRGQNAEEQIKLLGFEVKPFKTSSSTVIKLLAKPDALAMNVYDKLGVRFVTESMFDAYQVVRLMVEENLISYPHIMPDQSSNNIYPVDLFLQVSNGLRLHQAKTGEVIAHEKIQVAFQNELDLRKESVEYLRKQNSFSGADYRFIKFIARKLIRVQHPERKTGFSFFFPFEVQIMDKASHEKILNGPAEHQSYKARQRDAARKRVFPDFPVDPEGLQE